MKMRPTVAAIVSLAIIIGEELHSVVFGYHTRVFVNEFWVVLSEHEGDIESRSSLTFDGVPKGSDRLAVLGQSDIEACGKGLGGIWTRYVTLRTVHFPIVLHE